MFRLLTVIKEAFEYKTRLPNSRDLGDPDQSLTAIGCDLADQIFRLGPGDKFNEKLTDRLQILSREERTLLVDYHNTVYHFEPFTKACGDGLSEVVKYMCRTCSPDLKCLREFISPQSEIRMAPALWHAVVANHLPTVKVLLDAGADINAVSDTGSTPINSACFLGLEEMVHFLLNAGADISIPNNEGGTCLMNSVRSTEIFKALLEHGADMYARDCFQKTALHYAIEEFSPEIVAYLLAKANPFQIDANDRRHLIISSAIAGVEVYGPLIRVPGIHDGCEFGVEPDALEILGCTEFMSFDPSYRNDWILASRLRRARNVMKQIDKPIAHFEFRSECIYEEQLLALQTYSDFLYETLMIYMRVLGPTHNHLISTLEYYFDSIGTKYPLVANRIGLLLFNVRVQKLGVFNECVCKTSYEVIEHCFNLMRSGLSLNFETLFESLKIARDGLETARAGIDQASKSETRLFDWTLNFILLLLYVIKMQANRQQITIVMDFLRNSLLVNGREEGQLRTSNTGYTLLHLAVSKCNEIKYSTGIDLFPNWHVVQLLLGSGAPVNAVALDGASPLFVAVGSQNYNVKIAELLLCYGAHYHQVGPGGDTASEVLRRCLDQSNGALEPPKNMPPVRSL